MTAPGMAELTAWLMALAGRGFGHGWELQRAFLGVLGAERARSVAHRTLERLVDGGWIVQGALPAPSNAQRELLGRLLIDVLTLEAERRNYPDRTVFDFAPGPSATFAAFVRRQREKESPPS